MTNYKLGIWKEFPEKTQNYWSDQVYDILSIEKVNYSGIELLSKFVVPEDKSLFTDFLTKLSNDKSKSFVALSLKIRVPNVNGKRQIFLTAERVYDITSKKHQYWQGTLLDITPQIELEKQLQQSIDSFRGILNRIPILVLTVNGSGVISFWNKGCEDVTGYSQHDAIGTKQLIKQLIPDKQQRNGLIAFLNDDQEKSLSWEGQLSTKKGTQRVISWTAIRHPFVGESMSIVILGVDITKRKQQEKLQIEKRKRQEILSTFSYNLLNLSLTDNLYHFLGQSLGGFAKSSVYVVCSAADEENFFVVEGVYGLSHGELKKVFSILGWNPIGRRFQIFPEQYNLIGFNGLVKLNESLYELSKGVVSSVASRALERQLGIANTYTMGFFDGNMLNGGILMLSPDEISAAEIALVEGVIKQCAPAIRQRVREKGLVEKMNQANEKINLNSIFLANLSHEIRTPMNAILGFSKLLNLPHVSKDKQKQYVDIINAKGNMLLKLINDIVDVNKVEAKQLMLVNKPFYVNTLLQGIFEFYKKEKVFQQRDAIQIILDIPYDSDCVRLVGDEGRVEQVISNLMNNALKFTEKGEIRFGYTIKDDFIEFFVSDTGIGIAPEKQQIIFDRYRQLNDLGERFQTGSGLGLAICKGIVELMGGDIFVESHLAEGTTFRFTVPYSKPKSNEDSEPELLPETNSHYYDWKNKVLLVAEDEEINYVYIRELLEPTGVNIVWAKDGAQAVELVSSIKKFDAVLMDIKMPVKDGYAASLEIRHINPNIPIIAQTAYAFTEDRKKADAAGCDEFITKPISGDDLLAVLEKYLG